MLRLDRGMQGTDNWGCCGMPAACCGARRMLFCQIACGGRVELLVIRRALTFTFPILLWAWQQVVVLLVLGLQLVAVIPSHACARLPRSDPRSCAAVGACP